MVDVIFSVPYLFRIILSLVGILIFQKLTKSLEIALALGTILLALWTGHSFSSMAGVVIDRCFSGDTYFLVMVITGVIWLSSLMSESGVMRDLVICLKARLSKRTLVAALPAVVGLLPMPAGALFSAPLIDDADDSKHMSPLLKTQVNYWFRHIWEFWWPLYPGFLLAVDMAKLPVWFFALLLFPLFIMAIMGGYLFLLRKVPQGKADKQEAADKSFVVLIFPTLTVILVYSALLIFAPTFSSINKYLPMLVGVACALIVLQLQRPVSAEKWKKVLTSKRTLSLLLIVILARVYGAFIEAQLVDGTFLMDKIRGELNDLGIPHFALIIAIPFISGLTTGITIGYIGASFPVVLSLAGPTSAELYSAIILGYASGYLGMMLSPVHVCIIVTIKYFKTTLGGGLGGLLRPALLVFAGASLYSWIWSFLA